MLKSLSITMKIAVLLVALAACALIIYLFSSSSSAPLSALPSCYPGIEGSGERSDFDQADDTEDYQIHVIYAIPSDGEDLQYDTNGSIARSVSALNNWMCTQTKDKTLRFDTYNNKLDVTFVRLDVDDNSIKTGRNLDVGQDPEFNDLDPQNNFYIANEVAGRINLLGHLGKENKIYAIYYGGSVNALCGSTDMVTHSAVTFIGRVADECYPADLAKNLNEPKDFEFIMTHELLHVLGIVPDCAPHNDGSHVSDNEYDLMYEGEQDGRRVSGISSTTRTVLDFGNDDYFNANIPNCLDLADSTFLVGGGDVLPPVLEYEKNLRGL